MPRGDRVEEARRRHAHARERHDANPWDDQLWHEWRAAATDYWVLLHPESARFRRGDPTQIPTIDEMRERASAIARGMDGIPMTWRIEPNSRDRDQRAAQVGFWHELMHGFYDPIHHAIERGMRGDPSSAETLTRFLEADVYCHRSGYMKTDAIRALTHLVLRPPMRARLESVVLQAANGPDRREFRAYIRLARLIDSPALREALELMHAASDRRTARHARWMLDGIAAGGPRPPIRAPW